MKKIYIVAIVLMSMAFANEAYAQKEVKEKYILGTWKMIIDIDEELEEAEREVEEEDSFLGKVTLKWVSGLVSGLMDEIEIYMEFRPKGELKVMVEAFGEREIEYSSWYIDGKGRLFLDDTDSFSSDDDDYWLLDDDILVSYEDRYSSGKKDNVYMVRID